MSDEDFTSVEHARKIRAKHYSERSIAEDKFLAWFDTEQEEDEAEELFDCPIHGVERRMK